MGSFIKKILKPAGLKAVALAKANGQIPESAGTQATISSSGGNGGGRFGKIAKATGIATKMNGDTSASSTTWAVDRSFKKHKRNNIFGN